MSRWKIEAACDVKRSFRVEQIAGMFDVPLAKRSTVAYDVELPAADEDWEIGVIVGPSGSGKTTVARKAMGGWLYEASAWSQHEAVVDGFGEKEIGDITKMLTAVGFSSPPAWVKPYGVLSNGERFRCDLARAMLNDGTMVVYDEFTSVVDRTVAKIGSAAVSKAIRKGRITKKFVAVTCHYDIIEWLEPDWVLDMGAPNSRGVLGQLTRRRLRRPGIEIEIVRCHSSAWALFKAHHYLSADLNKAAVCFLATVDGVPAAFVAWLPFVGKLRSRRKARRGHRAVVLPDYQGVGIGHALINTTAAAWRGLGYDAIWAGSHPADVRGKIASGVWRMTRAASRTAMDTGDRSHLRKSRAFNRLTTGFVYVGESLPAAEAQSLVYA